MVNFCAYEMTKLKESDQTRQVRRKVFFIIDKKVARMSAAYWIYTFVFIQIAVFNDGFR